MSVTLKDNALITYDELTVMLGQFISPNVFTSADVPTGAVSGDVWVKQLASGVYQEYIYVGDEWLPSIEVGLLEQTTIIQDISNALINFASDFIQTYTNRNWIAQDYTQEKYDGDGDKDLFLDNFPINSVSYIASWDTYNNQEYYEFAEHTEYQVYLEEGYIYLRSGFVKGRQNYRVSYNAGYAIANVPWDIKKACADLCQYMYSLKDKIGVDSERIGTYSIKFSKGASNDAKINGYAVPAEIMSLLLPHRNKNI